MISNLFENHMLFRRLMLIYACMMTSYVTFHSVGFAYVSEFGGVETTSIIVAMQAPTSLLLGYMFKNYNDARQA